MKRQASRDPNVIHLFFNIRHSTPASGYDLKYLSSKLKLFFDDKTVSWTNRLNRTSVVYYSYVSFSGLSG